MYNLLRINLRISFFNPTQSHHKNLFLNLSCLFIYLGSFYATISECLKVAYN